MGRRLHLLPVLLAALLTLALAGCGGDDEDSPAQTRAEQPAGDDGTIVCPPVEGREIAEPDDRAAEAGSGTSASLRLKEGTLRLSVSHTKTFDAIGGAGGYRPEKGRFVVVNYDVTNRFDRPVEAANAVNRYMVVDDGESTWAAADMTPGCNPVPAFVKRGTKSLESPESNLEPGDTQRTLAVYVVPDAERDLEWVAPDGSVRIPLPTQPG